MTVQSDRSLVGVSVGDPTVPEFNIGSINLPASRVFMPEHTDYYLISDHELTSLQRTESSVLSGFGFAFLGGAIGLSPSVFGSAEVEKVYTASDKWTLAIFAGSAVGAVICLFLFWIATYRNRGLAAKIRDRRAHDS